jgi:putative transposase
MFSDDTAKRKRKGGLSFIYPSAKADGNDPKRFNIFVINKLILITMSYVKIWIHLVFSTKNRNAFLSKEYRQELHQHIIINCKAKNIFLQTIGGYTDHVHCLISLGKKQSIADIAQLIKGESSFWINQQKWNSDKFHWQDDYFAVSVSESKIEVVSDYIST